MTALLRRNAFLSAAVVAVPLALASVASAQYQVNNGDRLDASNRVGSAGQNEQGRINNRGVTPEDIVYGNVTAGREFRGNIRTFDAREFRGGTTGGNIDQFVRNSSGSPNRATPRADLTQPQAFYGESRGVAPPTGYVQNGFSGGYIPPSDALRTPGSYELSGRNISAGPLASTLLLPGIGDAQNNRQTMFSGSPLTGLQQVEGNRYTQDLTTNNAIRNPNEQSWGPQRLDQLQRELNEAAGQGQDGQRSPDQQAPGSIRNESLTPMESPDNARLQGTLQSSRVQGSSLSGDIQNSAGQARRLPSPTQQSTQLAELERRMQRYQGQPGVETMRQEQGREQGQSREGQQGTAQGNRGTGGQANPQQQTRGGQPNQQPIPRVAPGGAAQPQQPQPQIQPPANLPAPRPGEEPLQIKSLADGVKAEGLANILRQAEQSMRDGKFLSAVQEYDRAQQVAPNNPLIQLGRAHAMLGGSYFSRADQALRQAIASDPALLMAQYDLKGMIGERRLNDMVEELKKIASAEKTAVQPVFLLAYVAYNSENEAQAQQWLNEASTRANNRDAIINLMKQYWAFAPQGDEQPAQPELNK